MTRPVATCLLCPAPRATYTAYGVTRPRPYCAAHWNAYVAAARAARRRRCGVPDGWQVVRTPRLLPPVGVTRVLVDRRRARVVIYRDHLRRTFRLRHPERWLRLVWFFQETGYATLRCKDGYATLERTTQP